MKVFFIVLAIAAGASFGWFVHEQIDRQEVIMYPTAAAAPEYAQPYTGPPISPMIRTLAQRDLLLFAAPSEIAYIAAQGDQSAKVKKRTAAIEEQMGRLTSHEPKAHRFYQGDRLLLMQTIQARVTTFESAWAVHVGADSATRANAQQRASACSALARTSARKGWFVGWRIDQNGVCLNVPDNANLHTVLAAALAYTGNQLASNGAGGTNKSEK